MFGNFNKVERKFPTPGRAVETVPLFEEVKPESVTWLLEVPASAMQEKELHGGEVRGSRHYWKWAVGRSRFKINLWGKTSLGTPSQSGNSQTELLHRSAETDNGFYLSLHPPFFSHSSSGHGTQKGFLELWQKHSSCQTPAVVDAQLGMVLSLGHGVKPWEGIIPARSGSRRSLHGNLSLSCFPGNSTSCIHSTDLIVREK